MDLISKCIILLLIFSTTQSGFTQVREYLRDSIYEKPFYDFQAFSKYKVKTQKTSYLIRRPGQIDSIPQYIIALDKNGKILNTIEYKYSFKTEITTTEFKYLNDSTLIKTITKSNLNDSTKTTYDEIIKKNQYHKKFMIGDTMNCGWVNDSNKLFILSKSIIKNGPDYQYEASIYNGYYPDFPHYFEFKNSEIEFYYNSIGYVISKWEGKFKKIYYHLVTNSKTEQVTGRVEYSIEHYNKKKQLIKVEASEGDNYQFFYNKKGLPYLLSYSLNGEEKETILVEYEYW